MKLIQQYNIQTHNNCLWLKNQEPITKNAGPQKRPGVCLHQ